MFLVGKGIKEKYLPIIHVPQTRTQPEFGQQKLDLIKSSF